MAELNADQLTDLRADIGDTGAAQAFTDDELQRLYTRAGENYNKAVLLAFRQLLGNSWKFTTYKQNQSSENKSDVFKHLKQMAAYWGAIVLADESADKPQLKIVGRRAIPPQKKSKPHA